MLEDLINRLSIEEGSYSLDSDFSEVIDTSDEKLIDVALLNRPGKYAKALVAGPHFPIKGTKGVVFFVSKSKYPVFIPLNFGVNNISPTKPGEIVLSSESKNSSFTHLSGKKSDFKILDRTYPWFGLRGNSPSEQQYVLPSVEQKLKYISFNWYNCSENIDKSKFVPGDISILDNVPFDTHKGHTGGNKIDCYTTLDETDVSSKYYSLEKCKKLLKLCFESGAYLVGFYDPKNQKELETLFSGLASWKDHTNHFHVEFNIS